MLSAVAAVFLILASAAPAAAQQQAGSECAAIVGDVERLACYDAVFRPRGSETAVGPVILESARLIPAQPSGREPATLTVACESGRPEVSFAFAGQLLSVTGDIAAITLQVDHHVNSVHTLSAAPDNRSLSFASARETEAFLNSLVGGTNLRVRMTPVRQRSLTVDFRIDEAIGEITALRESCRPTESGS